MKKGISLFVIIILLASCSSETRYVVKGKIEGSDSIIFYLQKREAGKVVTLDSAVSKKGDFTMKGGVIDYPQLVQLVAGETRKRTSFYLENSVITVSGSLDSLFKAEITGSKTQDEYKSFVESNKPLTDIYSQIYSEYQQATQTGNTDLLEEIERRADSVQTEMLNNQKNFVQNNPSSYVTPSILGSISYEMEADELESVISKLDTAIASLPQIVSLKERVMQMKAVSIGQKAPDFTMNDVNGNPVSLSSKIGSKLLLIDFWAAWCGPCRKENPNVVKVYTEFNKKGFDIFGVSLDQKKDDWLKAIADDKLTWTHVSDLQYWSNAAAKTYAVSAIPANFLLDETGTIIGRNLRGEDLYNKVKEVLGSK
ncbi:MAG TPA: TlpA disulfide reductase family protein [Bacteroidales bacterium]|nr:TlpA disulfide reductase family protein [Bacteroidales bacterium]